MGDLLFIANPAARGFTGGLYRRIKSILDREHAVEHVWPGSPTEVEVAAADASTRGVDTVVVMGGDGVIHHAAQALVGGRTSLAVIPAGTANVFAKLLGIPERPLAAARQIAGDDAQVIRQPVARLTLTGPARSTTHYATFNIGLGYDADVVSRAEAGPERKARLGTLHYAGNAWETAWAYRKQAPSMIVTVNGTEYPSVMTAIQLHDTYTYFGRVPMIVGPPEPLSGIAVRRLGMSSAVSMALRSFRGGLTANRRIGQFSGATRLVVDSDNGVAVQSDGEWLGNCHRAEIQFLPATLPVLLPPAGGRQ